MAEGVVQAFAVRNLHDVRVEIVSMATKLSDTCFKRVPRPRRFVEKYHKKRFVSQ